MVDAAIASCQITKQVFVPTQPGLGQEIRIRPSTNARQVLIFLENYHECPLNSPDLEFIELGFRYWYEELYTLMISIQAQEYIWPKTFAGYS
jgi:hypothetical protein